MVSCSGNKGKQYSSLDDAATDRIGVLMGTTQDDYITKNFPQATVVRVDAVPDMLLSLKGGKCDVVAVDASVYKTMCKTETEVCLLDGNLYEGPIALGFNLENRALREEFNKMLAELRADGTYDEIYDRWVNNPNPVMPVFDEPATGTPLRVGVTSGWPPCDYYQDGESVGLDSELARRLGQRLGRPVQFQIISFGGLVAAISSGKVDVIAAGLSVTPVRAKNVAFGDSHYSDITVAGTLKKNLATITKSTGKRYTTKEDLSTKRIAVLMGSTHDAYITKNFPIAEIVRCDSYADVIMELTSGKCDAALFSPSIYSSIKKSNPQIEILDGDLFQESSGIGFGHNQNALKEQFNAFLKEIRANKLYDEIYDRWINNGDNAEMPDIKMSTSGERIRAAVSGTMVPFCFIRNGEHVGFDIEILLRFAQSVNRPIEFSVINFGGLISALNSGKVDVIAAFLAITPERVNKVNFSDVYLVQNCVMAVLDVNLAASNASATQTVEKQGFFASVGDSFYNNLIAEKRYVLILNGLWQTLIISLFAALLGTVIGAVVCFMRMSKSMMLNSFAKGYITIMRGIPVLVLLMLLYYVVFAKWDINATIVAILTFALNFAAYVSEMFRTSIQGVDRGQSEAGIAMGFTKVQTFIFVVMPQAIKSVLPIYKGELISLIKMTSVVGYIAVEDLTKASDIIRSRTFDAFFPLVMVAVIYFLLAWGFTAILDSINKKMTAR